MVYIKIMIIIDFLGQANNGVTHGFYVIILIFETTYVYAKNCVCHWGKFDSLMVWSAQKDAAGLNEFFSLEPSCLQCDRDFLREQKTPTQPNVSQVTWLFGRAGSGRVKQNIYSNAASAIHCQCSDFVAEQRTTNVHASLCPYLYEKSSCPVSNSKSENHRVTA